MWIEFWNIGAIDDVLAESMRYDEGSETW